MCIILYIAFVILISERNKNAYLTMVAMKGKVIIWLKILKRL